MSGPDHPPSGPVRCRECEICGQSEPSLVYEVDGYKVVRCPRCGLLFIGDPPEEDHLPELYSESYWETPDTPGYDGYGAAESRKRLHYRGLLDRLERLVSGRGDLLEIGSAYGYFLAEARARGWRVQGIEPSSHAASRARQQLDLTVHEGRLEDLPSQPDSLDAVALWDVIEHLPRPLRTLQAAAARLRPGGILALSTGDAGSLSARLHGRHWSLLTPPWHLFYFSRPTLAALVGKAGLRVARVDGDGVVGVDPASSQPRLHPAIRRILLTPGVVRVLRRLGLGMTVYAWARKPPLR